MSAAYKYAAFQTFCIPTEGDNDADAVTHVVQRAPVVDMESYEAEHLPGLREAALDGQETLAAAFGKIAKSPEKAAFWQKHGASLKAAAQKSAE
jgi:hypothetical protein